MRSRGRAGWAVVVLAGCRLEAPDADAFAGASEGAMGTAGTTAGPVGEATTGSTEAGTDGGTDATADASTSEGGGGAESSAGLDASSDGEGTTGTSETNEGTSTGSPGFCGDGNIDPGEVCDDGVNDGSYGGCAGDCQLAPFCGNGIVDGPEACDDGVNDGAYGGCLIDCLALAERCGDGAINGPEACDDGVNDGAYGGCALGCLALGPYCGDGVVSELELCDDGLNDGSYEGCAPGCLALAAYCGDGLVDAVEACDDGVNDGAYGGCAPGCAVLAEHCGDGIVSGPELCDDGLANGSYGGCAVGCAALAEHCGDGAINGPEVCDDGVNDGAYGSCGLACLSPPTYCGDGMVDGPEACDDGNADAHDGCLASCEVPTSCVEIKAFDVAATDGAYVIDVDGVGGAAPFEVYCNMTIDGGGWQLVSVRYQDIGVLFADAVCTGIGSDCSGTIPDLQLVPGDAPDLLFATTDGVYWLRLTGLNPLGAYSLLDVIALDRVLVNTDSCTGDNYCSANLDTGLMVAGSSPNFVPRFATLPSQYARYGGIWLGNGGGSGSHHVVSLNYANYCNPSGLQLSDASAAVHGSVTCTQPGALYFRY